MPIAPRLVAELNANLPGAVRRGDALLTYGRCERIATGFAALDVVLDGGLPRGRLSELVGTGSAGLTSIVHRLLGRVIEQGQLAAWIDAPDAFDPASAIVAGMDLERLLWVRPPDLATAFSAAEALLGMGGFPLVLLDARIPAHRPRVPGREGPGPARGGAPHDAYRARRGARMDDARHVWMRLARASASSRSALVVLRRATRRPPARDDAQDAQSGAAGFSAAVRIELEPLRVKWDRSGGAPTLLDGLVARVLVTRNRGGRGDPGPVVLEIA